MFSNEPVDLSQKMEWDIWSIANPTCPLSVERAKARKAKEEKRKQTSESKASFPA